MTKKLLLGFLGSVFLFFVSFAVSAQAQTGSIHGTVADPSGAVVQSASITITGQNGYSKIVMSGGDGAFVIDGLAPGSYTLSVSAEGFAPFDSLAIQVVAGKSILQNIALKLPVATQNVTVSDQGLSVDTTPDNNAGAMVIKGKDLDALSDDPDELQSELTALAGGAAGPNGGQIYIDGFTGGQLPPKSSIREIRINQNPFAAQYDKLGYGRIEILTKPGTDKLH
ncbi:MAG: carboxypeptidase-like regulatory domain-containing protein, partial [Terracidiphilus sp.]